jgi:hypothetical protein
MVENNNLTTPANETTGQSPWGVGVELVATYADRVEKNVIAGNANDGLLGFEFKNGPAGKEIPFQFAGNKIANNTFTSNGSAGEPPFAGDVTLEGGVEETPENGGSKNDCLVGNSFTAATYPENIQKEWGCMNKTTPNPGGGAFEYIVGLSIQSIFGRTPEGQPVPPEQPTMPEPCSGTPKNALCE